MADGFRAGADTLGALSRDPQALKDTIAEGPATLAVGTTALRNTRPFLHSLAAVSADLRGAAAQLRQSAPTINTALRSGIGPLQQTPALNRRLTTAFGALTDLAKAPGTSPGVAGLNQTMATLNPLLRFLGPYVTVCNYWNYSWTYLAEHITDVDQTGQIERIRAKQVGQQQSGMGKFGQWAPAPGLHAQYYGAAVDPQGNADCETGQRGYPRHVATGIDPNQDIAIDPYVPVTVGTTFTGRPRVPAGETFDARPQGPPAVRP
jgi:hypothetical protein